ncbi:uncharacterized protein LOC128896513 [Hylaeus anthracinus]|uniref:uncharacterized protein LOC128896513 n=1 Tax=Hylaeus anthracinus TaxID=313031 RepID=UPI0023B99612|nr:uncharacterized protein LOC128896513 [Hylaeus anthracinus]
MVRQRIEKIEHLVQTGVCQVLESLPIPLHAMLSAQMRNEGKAKSARRFSDKEKLLAMREGKTDRLQMLGCKVINIYHAKLRVRSCAQGLQSMGNNSGERCELKFWTVCRTTLQPLVRAAVSCHRV